MMEYNTTYSDYDYDDLASYGNDVRYSDASFDEPGKDRLRLLLMGMRRSGKSSIEKVVFHKLPAGETLHLQSTIRIEKDDIIRSYIEFQIWDVPGQIDFLDPAFDSDMIFADVGALVFVIDALDEYFEALQRLHYTLVRAYRVNPGINFEVFIHKVDVLSDESKMDILQEIEQRVRGDLDDENLTEIPLNFHLTSIYDHSIFEAFSKVIQKLIPQLPTLENLLNMLCLNSCVEKSYLFDAISKIFIATDSSPFDSSSYGICSDMIDVVIDVVDTFWTGALDDSDQSQDQRSVSAIDYSTHDGNSVSQASKKSNELFAVIKLQNNTVLYMREVNKYLALVCLMRNENYKQGLFDYNFQHFKESVSEILDANSTVSKRAVLVHSEVQSTDEEANGNKEQLKK
ncbi:uncharacterized protein VTP21DRAFT_505 [Calcarisporiella thermophila]|uniref:uncharacterized protein n=1 Tax=Calcarisporiella thermophila TaxID=911321 RepID=UPI003742E12C